MGNQLAGHLVLVVLERRPLGPVRHQLLNPCVPFSNLKEPFLNFLPDARNPKEPCWSNLNQCLQSNRHHHLHCHCLYHHLCITISILLDNSMSIIGIILEPMNPSEHLGLQTKQCLLPGGGLMIIDDKYASEKSD